MNEQTLELQIKSKAQEAKSSVESLVKSLTNVENVLTNIYLELGSIEKKSNVEKTTKQVDTLKSSADKATTSVNKLGKALSLGGTYIGAKKLTMQMLSWMNEAVDFTEQLNLFNVVFDNVKKNGVQTFSELGRSATKFQYKLNEAFGTNKTQSLYMQGIYQSMGETVGIPENYASIISENTTKLTYDLASLFNKSEKTTAEALRAGVFAGQTKPLRAYGIDVTQQSLQPILDSLGINKQVKEMSQAEKEILRYLATLKQAQIAMGDLANTIESPSNQLKIFRQQLVETKVAVSNLFIGLYSNVLPYANAFLMVVKEISKAIADMFGIELTDYNSGIASQEGIYDGIEESADNANKAVKELKRQVLGFDEIHNINENKDNGNGTNLTGGIDQRLLDAIHGYDNGMESVRMKATQIRDNIMDWLGFTKEIDPLTGEVGFKYNGINKTLKNIWGSFKGLNTQSKILVGIGLYSLVSKLFSGTKKLTTSLGGTTGLLGVTKKLVSPMKNLYNSLDDVNYANKSLTQGLSEGITNWSKSLTMADKFKVSLIGILGLTTSMYGMSNAMKSVSNEGWNLTNSLQAVASGIGGIASGAYIGSIFGPWGTVIGGATGAVLELISAIDGYNTASEKMIQKSASDLEVAKQNLENYYDTKKAIESSMNDELALHEYNQRLLDELSGLVDANGKVKLGYEERVNFILNELNSAYGTEYSIINGTISGYKSLNKTIKDVIQTKKSEIMLEAERENYTNAIKEQKNAWVEYRNAVEEYNSTNTKYNDILNEKNRLEKIAGSTAYKNYKYYSELTKKTYEGQNAYNAITRDLEAYSKTLQSNWEALGVSQKTFENYTNDIIFYEDLQTAVLSENIGEQNKLIEDRLNKITNANGEEKLSLSEQLQFYDDVAKNKLKILEENGVKITDEMRKQANNQKESLISNLIEQSKTIDILSPQIVSSWSDLATNSEEEFIKAFGRLDEDVQKGIIDKMYDNGVKISSELEKGIKSINPTINIKANVSSAQTTINSWLSGLGGKFISIFSDFFGGGSGGGRFKANGGIYSNGSWKDIPQYANGGAPTHGSLVFAGENGPEILGNANGKTEILNKSQIASSIYSAVYSAMSQFSGQNVQVDLYAHTDDGVVIDKINQKTKQTGVCPINIPMY